MSAVANPIGRVEDGGAPVAGSPGFLRRLLRRRVAVACLVYLAVVVVIAIVAPIVFPDISTQNAGNLSAVRQGPSMHHLLGTDSLGRDVLQRLLVGTRVTMEGVAEALVAGLALGVPLGLIAGYYGGWIDRLVGWLADLTFAIPAIIIILVVLSVFPQSMPAAMATLGFLVAPSLMRIIRSATLPVREELYIAAARVSGLSQPYIVARHVLPRVAGTVIVQASLLAALALLVQTGLAFLYLVVGLPAPSWGGMIADGASVITVQPWLIWPPGVAIMITGLALGLLGDEVRDVTTEEWVSSTIKRRRRRRAERVDTVRDAAAPATPVAVATPVATPADGALLSVRSLSVSFASPTGRVPVVEGATFSIDAGETVGLVGESGCGKTITATALIGLLPGTAEIDGGHILFAGRDLATVPESELRRIRGKEIGLITQEPMVSLNPAFRVGSQLAEAVRRHHGVSRRAARARVLELLADVRMPNPALVARRYPHQLSGGMAQRVAIARALAGEPRLLIADEPTTALDVTIQAEILDLLRDLQRDRKMAMLLVTHDWGVVADICDRAVVMYAGQVVERAELRQVFGEPRHPYTEALLASNPQNALEAEQLPTIAGTVPQPGMWPRGCHFHPRCRYATDACREQAVPIEQLDDGRETRCIHHDQLAVRR